ncbi:MAG: HEPN domain-containing protein [Phormidesmis sp.]
MSEKKLIQEAESWYKQAVDDLEGAEVLLAAQKYALSCFCAQQAGEKALKALWRFLDLDPWGHSCVRLVRDLPKDERSTFDEIMEAASALDKLYIPTRYPDALAGLTPAETYVQNDGQAAIASAQEILDYVKARISQTGDTTITS